MPGEPEERSEDCLTVNVWTPGADEQKRPVLVWIHGGAFTSGSGAGDLYRGGVLSRHGDVVVVTVNYRLGALGFLAHPRLAAAAEGEPWLGGPAWRGWGNWGLADQVGALAWVRDNIDRFGGDPANVTVFGESAGGMSISALLAVPEARGLFRRAVVESGPPYSHAPSVAETRAEEVGGLLGMAIDREGLISVPPESLVDAVRALGESLPNEGLPLLPVVDGGLLDRTPEVAIADGTASDVPLLIGTNRDESAFFAAGDSRLRNLDEAGLTRWVTTVTGDGHDASALVDAYRQIRSARGEGVSPVEMWVALASDVVFRLPTVEMADSHAASARPGVGTFGYLFTWESPLFGGALGSCHALEIPFVFGTVTNPAIQRFAGGGDAALALSDAMRSAWCSFAADGVPVLHASTGGDMWPGWSPMTHTTAIFGPWPGDAGSPVSIAEHPRREELDALTEVLARRAARLA